MVICVVGEAGREKLTTRHWVSHFHNCKFRRTTQPQNGYHQEKKLTTKWQTDNYKFSSIHQSQSTDLVTLQQLKQENHTAEQKTKDNHHFYCIINVMCYLLS